MKNFIVVLLLLAGGTTAYAQHPPEHMLLHEQFYSTWMIAPARTHSCCNNQDCYPTQFRHERGKWWALRREDGAWVEVPAIRLEHNQADSRDSPDGQGHVCMNPDGFIFCAVLGSGT